MTLQLYGTLRILARESDPQVFEHDESMPLAALIQHLNLPEGSVKMAMVNNRPVFPDALVGRGDSVALFPNEYPFFADWKDYWQATRTQGS